MQHNSYRLLMQIPALMAGNIPCAHATSSVRVQRDAFAMNLAQRHRKKSFRVKNVLNETKGQISVAMWPVIIIAIIVTMIVFIFVDGRYTTTGKINVEIAFKVIL